MGCPNLSVNDYFHFVEDEETDENGFFFVEDENSCERPSPCEDENPLSGNFCEVSIDPDGNLLSDGRFTYTWDGENRLISVSPIHPVADSLKLAFTYDYMGRRVSKTVYSWDTNTNAYSLVPVASYKYAWDGWNCIAKFNASNALQESYLWGEDLSGSLQGAGGVGGLLAVSGSTGTYIPAYDGNGNIMAYVDASNGNKVAEYEYDAFGRTIVKAGVKADDMAYRFSTKEYIPEMEAYDFGRRFYLVNIGRWASKDPIEENGGENLYAFVGNNPVNKFDVIGLIGFDTEGLSILHWWLDGSGDKRDLNDEHWGNYMRKNETLRNKLKIYLVVDAENRKKKAKTNMEAFTINEQKFPVALKENGYQTGYEMLHETLGFKIIGSGEVKKTGSAINIQYKLTYKWDDRIDPNFKEYPVTDTLAYGIVRGFGMYLGFSLPASRAFVDYTHPKDYDISISWQDDSSVCYSGNSEPFYQGYPFENKGGQPSNPNPIPWRPRVTYNSIGGL